jgi:transcriptional regulator with XRE-family HTH domain
MEFKDKLKNLRTERNITQKDLAEAIYVSRSAVAKWENGRGLPNDDSKKALALYFGVAENYFEPEQQEQIDVEKRIQKERRDNILAGILCGVLLLSFVVLLLYHIGFRFNSRDAVWGADYPVLHTRDYDFYFQAPSNDDGTMYCMKPWVVKRYGFLYYRTRYADQVIRLETKDQEIYGYLMMYKGKKCNYYFYISEWKDEPGKIIHLHLADKIMVNGEEIEMYRKSYFTMEDPIKNVELLGEKMVLVTQPY